MDKTINAKDVQPGMTITHETDGIKSILTVGTVEREEDWITLWTAEGGITCIRTDTQVTVEADRPETLCPMYTMRRIPGGGSAVNIGEPGSPQWVSSDEEGSATPSAVGGFWAIPVVYVTEPDDEVTEVPDVVKRWQDWERDNTEWRKHKWKDNDGDMWEWLEDVGKWRVEDSYGILRDLPGPSLFATFPVTRVQ